MSRIKTACVTFQQIISSVINSPRSTIDAIKLLPSLAKGLEYARSGNFKKPPEQANNESIDTNPLRLYFDGHTEGPGLWKWLHYFNIYHQHFKKFIGREVHVLEIGVYSGGSLGMWKEYFGHGCHIYGVDIEPACLSYKSEGIDVFIGDQTDRNFWKRFKEVVPKVDILIDDGGHDPEQQRITLEEMLPHIQPGGIYLCEDIGGIANKFTSFVSGLVSNLNTANRIEEIFDAPVHPTGFQASVSCITQYPFVTVIEKRDIHPGLFSSCKHGTEWQPY